VGEGATDGALGSNGALVIGGKGELELEAVLHPAVNPAVKSTTAAVAIHSRARFFFMDGCTRISKAVTNTGPSATKRRTAIMNLPDLSSIPSAFYLLLPRAAALRNEPKRRSKAELLEYCFGLCCRPSPILRGQAIVIPKLREFPDLLDGKGFSRFYIFVFTPVRDRPFRPED
jgi:hypothetical protein